MPNFFRKSILKAPLRFFVQNLCICSLTFFNESHQKMSGIQSAWPRVGAHPLDWPNFKIFYLQITPNMDNPSKLEFLLHVSRWDASCASSAIQICWSNWLLHSCADLTFVMQWDMKFLWEEMQPQWCVIFFCSAFLRKIYFRLFTFLVQKLCICILAFGRLIPYFDLQLVSTISFKVKPRLSTGQLYLRLAQNTLKVPEY